MDSLTGPQEGIYLSLEQQGSQNQPCAWKQRAADGGGEEDPKLHLAWDSAFFPGVWAPGHMLYSQRGSD